MKKPAPQSVGKSLLSAPMDGLSLPAGGARASPTGRSQQVMDGGWCQGAYTLAFFLLLFGVLAGVAFAQQIDPHENASPQPWFATFSIVAFDPVTNQLGVAVQSRAFGAGAAVPYAKAGVGAVATQAAANRSYGPKAIAMLEQGMSPAEAVKKMVDEDPGRLSRQVAVIDAKAMAAAFEHTEGPLQDRLMAALDAGQSKGGDARGMQSAGILVVQPVKDANREVERIVDLRVDDAVDPFKEMHRLLNLRAAGTHTQRSTELAQGGRFAEALAEQKIAVEMNPRSEQVHYGLAQRYAQAGELLNAMGALQNALRMQPALKKNAAVDPLFAKLKDFAEFRRMVEQ